MVKIAFPVASNDTVPIAVVPSKNVALPLGMAVPDDAVTFAVKFKAWPAAIDRDELVSDTLVGVVVEVEAPGLRKVSMA